jgi:signal transduction histidine kinase
LASSVKNSSEVRAVRDAGSRREPEVALRFDDVRRAEALSRLKRASFFLLPPLTLALAVNVRVFGDSMPLRALALIGMLGLAAVTHFAVSQRFAGRRAIPLAITFVFGLSVLLMGMLFETPGGRDVHLGTISALMMGAAIIVPWGVWPQLAVAVLIAVAYAMLPRTDAVGSTHVVDLAMSLTDCVALSVVGAYVLDRQRQKAFRESEQARRMTRQRELLLDASAELNTSLDFDETVATIVRVGQRLLGTDTVALILIDDRRELLRTAAVAGDVRDVDREVLNLEVPLQALEPLLSALRTHGFARSPGPGLDALAELARDQFAVLGTLFAAVEREGRLLGYINFNVRQGEVAFTDEQIRLARGFASQCAIALANADLVAALKRANRVKSEFVSTMSHELRTPLSVILGYTDVLEEAVTGLEGRVVLERVRVAGRELLEFVQTTLDLNRLEFGQDPPQCEPVGMQELWDELAGQYAAIERPAGVGLRWEVVGAPIALTDRRKTKVIVKNLVGNALKFTSAGEVHVSVRIAGERCLVVVRDTGVGIPDEHLHGIFDMFRQVDNSDRREHGGVGLGLYIVRKLAEQLDATLDVRSTVGVGTTFTLSLPSAGTASLGAAAA